MCIAHAVSDAPMRANATTTHVPSTSSSDLSNTDRSDLLIHGFSEDSTDTIIDVRVTNLDSKSYTSKIATHEGSGTTRQREEKERLQTL